MTSVDTEGAIAASTVIIARNGKDGMEILAIERAKGMGFAGGAVAFPGGKVDPGDIATGERFLNFDSLADMEQSARIAAAREAFEEAGILLSTGSSAPADLRARLRPASDRHEIGFAELLAELDHRLDAHALVPFARWLPPSGLHKRFDTRFYVASLPEGEVMLADGHEAVHARWATPAQLLAEAEEARISILFPTRCNLERLNLFRSVEDLLADETPPPFINPRIEAEWITIPEGLGYPFVRERIERVRRS